MKILFTTNPYLYIMELRKIEKRLKKQMRAKRLDVRFNDTLKDLGMFYGSVTIDYLLNIAKLNPKRQKSILKLRNKLSTYFKNRGYTIMSDKTYGTTEYSMGDQKIKTLIQSQPKIRRWVQLVNPESFTFHYNSEKSQNEQEYERKARDILTKKAIKRGDFKPTKESVKFRVDTGDVVDFNEFNQFVLNMKSKFD